MRVGERCVKGGKLPIWVARVSHVARSALVGWSLNAVSPNAGRIKHRCCAVHSASATQGFFNYVSNR